MSDYIKFKNDSYIETKKDENAKRTDRPITIHDENYLYEFYEKHPYLLYEMITGQTLSGWESLKMKFQCYIFKKFGYPRSDMYEYKLRKEFWDMYQSCLDKTGGL